MADLNSPPTQGSDDGGTPNTSGDSFDRNHPAFKAISSQVTSERGRAEAAEARLAEIERESAERADKERIEAAKRSGDFETALAAEQQTYAARMAEFEQKLKAEQLGRQQDQIVGELMIAGCANKKAASFLAQDWLSGDAETRGEMAEYVKAIAASEDHSAFFGATGQPNQLPKTPADGTGGAAPRPRGQDLNAAGSDPNVSADDMWAMARETLTGG